MADESPQTQQLTIKDLAEFGRSLAATVSQQAEPDRLRAAIDQALAAECVQCGIRLTGSEVLKFADDPSDDPRVERLRVGYCARNGCASLFYNVIFSPHPQINWPALLNPVQALTDEEKAAAELVDRKRAASRRRNKALLRTSIALAALVIVFIIRQIYMGGTIPFVREPENFQVDKEVAHP